MVDTLTLPARWRATDHNLYAMGRLDALRGEYNPPLRLDGADSGHIDDQHWEAYHEGWRVGAEELFAADPGIDREGFLWTMPAAVADRLKSETEEDDRECGDHEWEDHTWGDDDEWN